ncbi:MAG: homoserine dehydrogenase, partial [Bacteroidota bacterium]
MGEAESSGIAPLRVAIAGLGTVGGGTVKLLQSNAELLTKRTGRGIRITAVSDRYRRERGFSVDDYAWYDDAVTMAGEADADVIVELIGGADGAAKQVCEAAIAAGRHVVTANKAMIAHH